MNAIQALKAKVDELRKLVIPADASRDTLNTIFERVKKIADTRAAHEYPKNVEDLKKEIAEIIAIIEKEIQEAEAAAAAERQAKLTQIDANTVTPNEEKNDSGGGGSTSNGPK